MSDFAQLVARLAESAGRLDELVAPLNGLERKLVDAEREIYVGKALGCGPDRAEDVVRELQAVASRPGHTGTSPDECSSCQASATLVALAAGFERHVREML